MNSNSILLNKNLFDVSNGRYNRVNTKRFTGHEENGP